MSERRRRVRRQAPLRVPLLPPALLALPAAACVGPQSALDPAGPYARAVATHWWIMFALGSTIFVLVVAAFVYAIHFARRERPADEPPAHAADDDDTARAKTRTVAIAVGASAVILVGVMLHAIVLTRDTYADTTERLLEIEVTGHQWWWEVRYLDPEPSRQLRSANELHIPVGRPVRLHLRSADVIHSFWVPNLAGKLDLIPGRENQLRLLADRPGAWRGQCAEFCGLQHAKMALWVVAHEPDDYAAWYARELQPAAPPADSLAAAGGQLFATAQCALCHRVRGTTAGGSAGPDLTHVASRLSLAAGSLPNTRGHLAGWILDPQAVKPGTHMPPTPLDGPSLHALLHYLETLR